MENQRSQGVWSVLTSRKINLEESYLYGTALFFCTKALRNEKCFVVLSQTNLNNKKMEKGIVITGKDGSGKSLIAKGICSDYRPEDIVTVSFNRRMFTTSNFFMADVNEQTKAVVFDGVGSLDDIYSFYDCVTDGMVIERMHKDPIRVHPLIILICEESILHSDLGRMGSSFSHRFSTINRYGVGGCATRSGKESLISEFKNGHERFAKSPLFNAIINQMLHKENSTVSIIDNLVDMNDRAEERLNECYRNIHKLNEKISGFLSLSVKRMPKLSVPDVYTETVGGIISAEDWFDCCERHLGLNYMIDFVGNGEPDLFPEVVICINEAVSLDRQHSLMKEIDMRKPYVLEVNTIID